MNPEQWLSLKWNGGSTMSDRWLNQSKIIHPSTTNWKSSNSSIATVATKGDSEGGHKVTAKKKGKVTISCIVSKTSGHWVKGDVFKWTVTVK